MKGNLGLLVTPFDDNQELDKKSLCKLIEYAIDDGVEGLIPLGTTGEFFSLTGEEKRQVIDITIDQARGRLPVCIGVGYSGTRISTQLAEYAEQRGATGVLIPPPYYYPLANQSMYLHFSTIAKKIGINVMLYDGGGGLVIPTNLIDQLNKECPNIRHVKVSSLDSKKVSELHATVGDRVQIFCGDEVMLMSALSDGAVGMATASGMVLPGICTKICHLFATEKHDEAREMYLNTIAPWTVASGIIKSEFVRCFKEVLAAKRVIASPMTRLPLPAIEQSRKEELLATAKHIGIL